MWIEALPEKGYGLGNPQMTWAVKRMIKHKNKRRRRRAREIEDSVEGIRGKANGIVNPMEF